MITLNLTFYRKKVVKEELLLISTHFLLVKYTWNREELWRLYSIMEYNSYHFRDKKKDEKSHEKPCWMCVKAPITMPRRLWYCPTLPFFLLKDCTRYFRGLLPPRREPGGTTALIMFSEITKSVWLSSRLFWRWRVSPGCILSRRLMAQRRGGVGLATKWTDPKWNNLIRLLFG